MLDLTLFLVISAGLLILSWASRRAAGAGGAYRFLALELVLILALLNRERWFTAPFSTPQLFSWLFLLAALAFASLGFYPLPFAGQTPELPENDPAPVKRGIYKYIRHPFGAALLFFGWGVFFKGLLTLNINGLVLTAFLLTGASLFLISAVRLEEADKFAKFGDEYAAYMKTTKLFIPFVF